jgi:hypothetical protein
MNVIEMPKQRTVCDTCGYRAEGGVYCWRQLRAVPDDYVCADYVRREPLLWKPGTNEDGD